MALERDLIDRTKGDRTRLEWSGLKVYSQSDEDGIIAEIFRRIGTTDRRFVEIGVEVGEECNTRYLLENGWTGLWIEGHPDYTGAIRYGQRDKLVSGELQLAADYVTADTINTLVDQAGIAGEIDLFSLDIDSNDYHVFAALTQVRPRVLVLEYNHYFPPPAPYIMPRNDAYRWDGSQKDYGASLVSLVELAKSRGYTLVGCGLYSANSFFVRDELVGQRFSGPFDTEHFWNPLNYPAIVSYPRSNR